MAYSFFFNKLANASRPRQHLGHGEELPAGRIEEHDRFLRRRKYLVDSNLDSNRWRTTVDTGGQPRTFCDEEFGKHGRWRTLVDMSAAIS
jgi:hypothetical protein